MQFVASKPPLEELALELDDEVQEPLELDELVLDPLPDELELVLDELLEELLEELLDEPALIVPVEAVSVTRSSFAPSSRRTIRSVCVPAARLLKVAGVIVP